VVCPDAPGPWESGREAEEPPCGIGYGEQHRGTFPRSQPALAGLGAERGRGRPPGEQIRESLAWPGSFRGGAGMNGPTPPLGAATDGRIHSESAAQGSRSFRRLGPHLLAMSFRQARVNLTGNRSLEQGPIEVGRSSVSHHFHAPMPHTVWGEGRVPRARHAGRGCGRRECSTLLVPRRPWAF